MIILKLFSKTSNIIAMTIAPFIIIRKGDVLKENTLRHEKIHVRQQLEMLIIFFYLWYVVEWILRGFDYWNISLEQEAYAHENDKNYLKHRKFWAFLKYINKKYKK